MKPSSTVRGSLERHGVREIMVRSAEIPGALHLEVGQPNFETPVHIQDAARRAIDEKWFGYTHNAGIVQLRRSLGAFLQRQYGLDVAPEQLVVTPGAVTALALGVLAVTDPGDEVLVPDPSWPNYWQMVHCHGAVPLFYSLRPENGFLPSMEELERLVTPRTKLLMINTPGNPTGAVFPRETMVELLQFARRHDLYLLSDEVYDRIVFDGEHVPALSLDDDGRVLSIYGVSKNFAMTGWRVGFLAANRDVASVAERTVEPMFSCVNSIAQAAAIAAYDGPQDTTDFMTQRYRERRDAAMTVFREQGVPAFRPGGAFYLLVDCSGTDLDPQAIAFRLLEEEGVAVGPGATFGKVTEWMIRLSLASDDADLIEGCRRICRFLKRHAV